MVAGSCSKFVVLAQPPFGVEIWAQIGETTRTAWKTQSLAACYVDFKRWHLRDCTTRVASETSKTITAWWLTANLKQMPLTKKCQVNNENSRASLTQHKAGLQWESWCLPTTLQLHFRALQTLYLGPLLDHGSWQLFQICSSCAAPFGVEIWAQVGQITSTACAIYKTRVASKTSKTITAW